MNLHLVMVPASFLLIFVAVSTIAYVEASYSFLALGDWGGAAIDEYKTNVDNVASQLFKTAKATPPSFLINTGDNFYWCGIKNTSDFQVEADFVEPYDDESVNVPWYSVLGNHEYGYNVSAQIELSNLYSRWVMDDRYYTRRIQLDSTNYATLLFLDTSPCIEDYRATNQKYWDPCSTTYPTCSLDSTDDDFEGPCEFNSNILSQSCDDQYKWLSLTLDTISTDDWLIVVGHHPLDEIDVLDFTSLVQAHGFSIYLNGHSHILNHYTIDSAGVYITSGAGALVNTADQSHPITAAKVNGGDLSSSDKSLLMGRKDMLGHSYQTVYSNKVAGFTQHIFSDDFSTLTTNLISYTGSIVHTFTSNKAGEIV